MVATIKEYSGLGASVSEEQDQWFTHDWVRKGAGGEWSWGTGWAPVG